MIPDGGGGPRNNATSGRSGGGSRPVLKKGPWTAAEDGILMDYVKKHGEGNWNAVQRNSGLNRCGKSCRLRWANHLRPNLKKGAFSAEEERVIVELHAKLGNKWARMAAQLPGRTDNEIKNYWNTRVKRRQRAGLPVYPNEMKKHHYHQAMSSSPSLSSLLSSPSNHQKINFNNPAFSLLNNVNFSSTPNPNPTPRSFNPQLKLFRDNNGGLALSLASNNLPFPSFNRPISSEFSLAPPVQFNPQGLNINSRTNVGGTFDPIGLGSAMGIELSSIQSPVPTTTPTSSGNSKSDNYYAIPSSSGLLEDLLEESHALMCAEKSKKIKLLEEANIDENPWEDINSSYSPAGIKEKKNPTEQVNCGEDDLFGLLDSLPLAVPLPDWYDDNASNAQSTDGNLEAHNQRDASRSPVVTGNQEWSLGSCCWNDMPGIY